MPNSIGATEHPQQDKSVGLKNVLGQDAATPFYVWANEDCDCRSDSFLEAKAFRLEFLNEGRESVYIVDADGVEVVDEEIEAHEALVNAGFFAGVRRPDVLPAFPGAFMVNDPQDPEGFAIVGDDICALILEARNHLLSKAPKGDVQARASSPSCRDYEYVVLVNSTELMKGDAGSVGMVFGNLSGMNFTARVGHEQTHAQWLEYMSAESSMELSLGAKIQMLSPEGVTLMESEIGSELPASQMK